MKHFSLLTLITFLHLNSFSQTNINTGQMAPPITITDWIANTPKDKGLKHKNIVLEFWATWCGPCIAAIPHMDSLQNKFKNSGIYFISITDEAEELVEKLLKRIAFKSIVVSDQSKKTQVQYGDGKEGIPAIPLTVLINKKGIISWIGRPTLLTESILRDFIDGKIIASNLETEKFKEIQNSENEDVVVKDNVLDLVSNKDILYSFELKKSKSKVFSTTTMGSKFLDYRGAGIIEILVALTGKEKDNIIVPENYKERKYDLTYKNLFSKENNLPDIEDDILKALGLKKEILNKNVPVYEVTISNLKLLEPHLDSTFSSKSDAGDNMLFGGYEIKSLITEINSFTSQKFVIENPPIGKYNFVIEKTSTERIVKSLESYGFVIAKAIKDIEFWNLSNLK